MKRQARANSIKSRAAQLLLGCGGRSVSPKSYDNKELIKKHDVLMTGSTCPATPAPPAVWLLNASALAKPPRLVPSRCLDCLAHQRCPQRRQQLELELELEQERKQLKQHL
ncbi:hypothetical protein AWZ03_007510 [Drosophila navojoa]|uniref:Uncharacterized protein n=1 Tax=Drosophila navojoa TaxID=7232 RepID=A0A484BE36_DRONA|nr:hypothetical protein AWZ03_007510 [Drosophila navojoa]